MEPNEQNKQLKRVLGLWDLIFYGIVLIQPIAAVGLFGIASQVSKGHMVLTLIIAMAGMMLTAASYGRMAALYPSAGSAYTYVGKGLNVHIGFIAGWVMFLDYLIVPIINTIYGALSLQRMFPGIPFAVCVMFLVVVITAINLKGISTTARSGEILLLVMCVVILMFLILAVKFIVNGEGWNGLLSYKPFYNKATFNMGAVMTATSFAALTYIGFDGVTTLAEEVKNPKRNMLLAPVLVCLITGIFSIVQIYLAQLVWPDYDSFRNPETAFFDVAAKVGGTGLFNGMVIILLLACIGSGIAGQAGAARLLFAMGRDRVLPFRLFSRLSAGSHTPFYNIILLAALTMTGSLVLNYQGAAELLNFGAFLAFMGVNIATLKQFFFRPPAGRKRNLVLDAIIPLLGFIGCLCIWISLPVSSKILGGTWLVIGIVYLAVQTKGFSRKPVMFHFENE